MVVYKENIIDGILFSLHFLNMPPSAAFQMLQKMKGAESCTLGEVEELFKKMDVGEFHLEKKRELNKLPDDVQRLVVKNLDMQSKLSVRKTCHNLRNLVDEDRFRINKLLIYWDEKLIKISVDRNFRVRYFWNENSKTADIKCGNRTKTLNMRNRDELFEFACSDLITIISNKNVIISNISFVQNSKWQEKNNHNPVLRFITKVKNLNLKAESLWLSSQALAEYLYSLLPLVDKNYIETIRLNELRFDTARNSGYDILSSCLTLEKVYEFEQWRNLTRLEWSSYGSMECGDYKHTTHLNYFNGYLNFSETKYGIYDFDKLIRDLLKNPNLEQFIIKNKRRKDEAEELQQRLGMIKNQNSHSKFHWVTFNYPRSNKKLRVHVARRFIWIQGPAYVET